MSLPPSEPILRHDAELGSFLPSCVASRRPLWTSLPTAETLTNRRKVGDIVQIGAPLIATLSHWLRLRRTTDTSVMKATPQGA